MYSDISFECLLLCQKKRLYRALKSKEMALKAQEDAKKITLDAETKATETLRATREDIKEKEDKLKKTEERSNQKRRAFGWTDKADIDKEVELLKEKVEEIKAIKERADKLDEKKKVELEKLAQVE